MANEGRVRIINGKKYYIFMAYPKRSHKSALKDAKSLSKNYDVKIVEVPGGYALYRKERL